MYELLFFPPNMVISCIMSLRSWIFKLLQKDRMKHHTEEKMQFDNQLKQYCFIGYKIAIYLIFFH